MKKFLIIMVLTTLAMFGATGSAYAEAGHDVSVDFTYVPDCPPDGMKQANDNMFLSCTATGFWVGDFEGFYTDDYFVALHGFVEFFVFDTGFYRGNATFDGAVEGKEGTLEVLFIGKSLGDINNWIGTWRIISGTGELENLHGMGTFYNNGPLDIHMDGQIHFDP